MAKDRQLMIRMSEKLLDVIRQRAEEMNISASAYIRLLVIGADKSLAATDLVDGRATGDNLGFKQIPLTRGLFALVDNEDFDRVNQYNWNCLNHGAAQARIGKTRVQMHRFILGLHEEAGDTKTIVDHINHNRLDNRRCNLRIATHGQNSGNTPSYSTNGKYKGVIDGLRGRTPLLGSVPWGRSCQPMKRYRAKIRYNGVTYDLGGYPTPEAAARAYDAKALEFFGEFACPNFPQELATS